MRSLIAIITLILIACVIGVIAAVMPQSISPVFTYALAAAAYFVWLQFARDNGLVDE